MVSVAIIGASVINVHGAIAADETPATTAALDIDLSGRWSGTRASRSMIGGTTCKGDDCRVVIDIVACGDQWCATRVETGDVCGGYAATFTRSHEPNRKNAFTGSLKLADGSAPYVIEAWYAAPGTRAGEGAEHAHMSIIGDTGSELRLFRRSFPFEATLERISDAVCKSDKPVS